MKCAYFLGATSAIKFEVKEIPNPQLESDEVLVKVQSCGICGTDVHIYYGEEGSAAVTSPVVLGHEFAGIVTEKGATVKSLEIGDHVTIDPNSYCGKCRPCRMGKQQNCENLFALGVNTNGGFAEYAVCPEKQCFKVLDTIDFDSAAMAEPLACAIHGIDNANIRTGQSVLVVGGGTIGLLMVQLARLSGASMVILSEPVKLRQKIGLEVGADAIIDPSCEDIASRINDICGHNGVDVVIECVGKKNAVEQAFSAAGAGSTILLFSVPSVDATLELSLFDVFKKELNIVGSIINPATHQRAVNLINSNRIEIKKLITHAYGINELEEALHMQMSNESIKVVIHPWKAE